MHALSCTLGHSGWQSNGMENLMIKKHRKVAGQVRTVHVLCAALLHVYRNRLLMCNMLMRVRKGGQQLIWSHARTHTMESSDTVYT